MKLGKKQRLWIKLLENKIDTKGNPIRQTKEKLQNGKNSFCCLGVCAKFVMKLDDNFLFDYMDLNSKHKEIGLRTENGVFDLFDSGELEKLEKLNPKLYKKYVKKVVSETTSPSLVGLNDTFNFTFPEIAFLLKKFPHKFFVKSV